MQGKLFIKLYPYIYGGGFFVLDIDMEKPGRFDPFHE